MAKYPRRIVRLTRVLTFVAALPLLQLNQCGTIAGQATVQVGRDLPTIVVNSLSTTLLETTLNVLGLGTQGLFGALGQFGRGAGS